MGVTAEMRWFGRGEFPASLSAWFRAPGQAFAWPPGGGRSRTDQYFLSGAPDLGIKRRRGKGGLEVKGQVDVLPWRHRWGEDAVTPRAYAKWTVAETDLPGLPRVEVGKTRWLRTFATVPDLREIVLGAGPLGEDPVNGERPGAGCDLELTRVTIAGELWWSFAAEAFAPGGAGAPVLDLVSESLRAALPTLAGAPAPGPGARYQHYGEWLAAGSAARPET